MTTSIKAKLSKSDKVTLQIVKKQESFIEETCFFIIDVSLMQNA